MIKIYYSCFTKQFTDEKLHHLLSLLPVEITERILKFRKWQDIQRALLGKLLLKKALLDFQSNSILSAITYNAYGRPNLTDLDFNISHSGNYAICAVSTQGQVGIDLEMVRPIDLAHFKSQFSLIEWQDIIKAEDAISKFFFYWTLKEAVIKADGRGLSLPLDSFRIKATHVNILNDTWYYKSLNFLDGYQAHIAFSSPPPDGILIELETF
ncbi:4'-phosphopantetheinyl transferase family protein [Pedobacter jejuensis]|uniref:4'-phosphopantetheinyl transferase superfamily protein n=1 Tax=Pedobacter jejuensis TaxID=1268550 RepID=A0A3N0BWW5_9SPHI|nr:4'-phosphopantetheinyl transferase superfamily protein [Pedobacter jejuensis]RNL53950.1 4'-phosphopantetheinyl transferase superfamily protein [Pedobacter jejuensis]